MQSIPMLQPHVMFDPEIRHRAVVHYKYFNRSLRKVGKIYGVSKSTMQRWVNGVIRIQKRSRKRIHPGRVPPEVDGVIRNALKLNPFHTLHELAHIVRAECATTRSPRTICRYLQRMMFSRKKAYRTVRHHKDHAMNVARFCNEYPTTPEGVVCIDEAGFYVGDCGRRGYSERGCRLNIPASRTLRRVKLTVIVAVACTGVVQYKVMRQNCKKVDFVQFVKDLPESCSGCKLVLDNIQFHHSKETKEALESKNIVPLYTPPYSPEFNAIESVFAAAKMAYRRVCPVGVNEETFDYKGNVESVFRQLQTADLTPYFQHVISYVQYALDTLETKNDALIDMIGYSR